MKHHILIPRRSVPVPVPQAVQGLLVDELGSGVPDTALASHPDVIWYATPNRTSDTDMIGSASDQWWSIGFFTNPWFFGPGDEGVNGGRVVHALNSDYGLYVSKWGSWYKDNHCHAGFSGQTVTYQACSINPALGLTIMSVRKWFTQVGANADGDGTGTGGLGTIPVTECYQRAMICFHTDIETYMIDQHHVKLFGVEGGTGAPPIWGYGKPGTDGAPAGHITLSNYFGSFEGGYMVPFLQDYTMFQPNVVIPLSDTHFYCLETYQKLNSAYNVADGILRRWVDDVLVMDLTGTYYRSPPSGEFGFGNNRGQIFTGGQGLSDIPNGGSMHHSLFGWVVARKRIGSARKVV